MIALINNETRTWSQEHNVIFDEGVRNTSKTILNQHIKDGIDIYMAYTGNAISAGVSQYQHWFVVAIEKTVNESKEEIDAEHYIEFGGVELSHDTARVNINSMPRVWDRKKSKHFTMNKQIRQRIEHVLGMKNYSLCLRNCEHVANYICRGRWESEQLNSSLNQLLLNPLMGDKINLINKFPSKIKPHVFLDDTNREQIYSFISDENVQLFKPYSLQYFLDQGEQDNTYNILFIGPTGAGKSRLINVLFNQEIVESEASLNSVTNDIAMIKCKGQVYDNVRGEYVEKDIFITDTIGLSDTELNVNNRDKLIGFLKDRISSNFRHFDLVYIVFSNDRLLREIRINLKCILNWLKYTNHVTRFRFIVTKSDDLNEADKARLEAEVMPILGIVPNSNQLHFTSFPLERVDGEDNLTAHMRTNIRKDLALLYTNIARSDNSSRVEVDLNDVARFRRICTIL